MKQGLFITFDLNAIWNRLKKQSVRMILLAVTAMMLTYMAYDNFVPKKYGTKVLFSIVSDNKNMIANSNRIYVAGKRMISYLEGDTVKLSLCEKMGVKESEFTGKIKVEALSSNNMILITCSDISKEAVFKLSKSIRENIPAILERFMKVYGLKALGELSIDSIQRTSKSPVFVAVLIGMLVFFAECFIEILLQIFSKKLQNRGQVEHELEQKLLGVVPHDRHKKKTESMLVDAGLRSLEYIESFQRLSTSISYACKKNNAKVIMVTSCLEDEGKSTIASNLAVTLAQNGKRVMLLDLDFRKPALKKIFEVQEFGCMSRFLKREISANDVLYKRGKNLYCCFTNSIDGQSDEVLEQEGIYNFIRAAKEKADFLILDTSPMANTRDPEVLMNLADVSVLVSRINAAPITLINDKIEILEDGGAKFLGVIINDENDKKVNIRSSNYNYQYRYQ